MPKLKQADALEDGGKGVGVVKDKKLTKLGDEFIEKRDQKAQLATELTALETKIKDRMAELGISIYRFGDQQMEITLGKSHVKVKTIKVEDTSDDPANPNSEEAD